MKINENTESIIRSSRLGELDVLKGIGILGVAMIHVVQRSFYFSHPNISFVIILDSLSRFCVPLFIFVAGVSFSYNYHGRDKYFTNFLLKRLKFIGIPYLFWSFLEILRDKIFTLKGILMAIFMGVSMIHLYFVPLIFQFYLISPLVMKISKTNWRKTIIISFFAHIIILLAYRLALFYSDRGADDLISKILWFPYNHAFFIFVFWFSYFVIGVSVGLGIDTIKEYINKIRLIIIMLFFLIIASISVYDAFFARFHNISFGGQFFSPINMIYTFAWIIFIWKSYESINLRAKSVLSLLGKHSFGIYLIHIPILHSIHRITKAYWGNPLEMILYFIVTVVISFILVFIASKVKFGYYVIGKSG